MPQKNIKNELLEWQNKVGIMPRVTNSTISIEYITNAVNEGLSELSAEQLEDILIKLTSYNIFLKAEKGRIVSQIVNRKEQFRRWLYLETQNLPVDGQFRYRSKEEKEATVLDNNDNIKKLSDDLISLELKFEQIRDIPYAIDMKIEIIKMIYKRRLGVHEQSKH